MVNNDLQKNNHQLIDKIILRLNKIENIQREIIFKNVNF